ncbi:MAG: hypothetical protein ABIX28_12685 [Vicinamibacterales bacterium]
MTAETVQQIWIVTLGIFVVVLSVVAALLTLILRTSKQIHGGVAAIWTVGQNIANNTVHLALLDRTNFLAGGILASAGQVAAATGVIAGHAERCANCPACVAGRGGRG